MQQADIDALANTVAGVVEQRRIVTGDVLAVPDVRSWPSTVTTDAEFRQLITDCYTWWKESWADEIQLLGRITGRGGLYEFTHTVNQIRTAQQHGDAPEAVRFAEDWMRRACGNRQPGSAAQWSDCGHALLIQLAVAAGALHMAAKLAASDERLAARWAQESAARTSVDIPATRDRILADLGLHYRDRDLAYIKRQIDQSWSRRVKTVRDDAQGALTHIVEMYLIGRSLTALPCPYGEVLEQLGLFADHASVSALWLAHVVAERGTYANVSDFLGQVEKLWERINAQTSE